jgi:hypothetical protein
MWPAIKLYCSCSQDLLSAYPNAEAASVSLTYLPVLTFAAATIGDTGVPAAFEARRK